MKVTALPLNGPLLLHGAVFPDARGLFMELWQQSRYEGLGLSGFVQTNHSRSVRDVLRGLHYQRQHPQGKLLTVVRGALFDVMLDLRRTSPSFGQWTSVVLTEATGDQLWVPPGFAHGFCVTSDVVDVIYQCTDVWHPGDSLGICWDDPALAIPWPTTAPLLSDADQRWPTLATAPIDPDPA